MDRLDSSPMPASVCPNCGAYYIAGRCESCKWTDPDAVIVSDDDDDDPDTDLYCPKTDRPGGLEERSLGGLPATPANTSGADPLSPDGTHC